MHLPRTLVHALLCTWFFSFAADGKESSTVCAAARRISETRQLPGVFISIVSRDAVLARCALGDFSTSLERDSETGAAPRYTRIGSITKTFNALLAMRLIEDGRLELATVCHDRRFCPRSSARGRVSEVTAAHLLEHTSGMADLMPQEMNSNTPRALAAAFAIAPESRLSRWPPGSFSSYSNNNAGVFAGLLESVLERRYETLMWERVLVPLDMKEATFARRVDLRAALPLGYAENGITPLPYWHMLFPAMGALNVRVDDMAQFIKVFLNRGRYRDRVFLSEQAISRMERPATALTARAGLSYGYGLGLYQWYRRGVLFFGHDGDADGYRSRFGYAPRLGVGYFTTINSDNADGLRALQRVIELSLVGAGLPIPPRIQLDNAARARILGNYQSLTARFPTADPPGVLRVTQHGERLYTIEANSRRRELIPVGPTRFRRRSEGGATIVLVETSAENLLLGDDLGNFRRTSPNSRQSHLTPVPPSPQ